LAASMLAAAERTAAVLVTTSNLYGYGPTDHPLRESDPLLATGKKGRVRAEMWADALAAHRAGRARVTEARASDYFGPGVRDQGHIGARAIPNLLDGRPVQVMGDVDVPHSWTYVPDIASALVILGTDERAWGRAWHVPTNPPLSQRQVFTAIAQCAAVPAPKLKTLPGWALKPLGLVMPNLGELDEVRYQFDRPFVIDSTAFESTFGGVATPIAAALEATVAYWLNQRRSAV
jgi:nucleoside-diphosphate-sugar epimerase